MLQRIQSVFLLLTSAALAVFLATNSFVKAIGPDEKVAVNPFHVFYAKGNMAIQDIPTYYVAVLAVLALILSIFTIFQYKNRVRQMLLVALNSLLIGLALGITVYHIQNDAIKMGDLKNAGTYGIGLYAAFIALASNWLANRFIKRDEKLVKDADRMR
jgi:Domain of unknown function (DUF4293)